MTPRFQKKALALVGLLVMAGCGGSSLASSPHKVVTPAPLEVSTPTPVSAVPVVAPTPEVPEKVAPPAPKRIAPPAPKPVAPTAPRPAAPAPVPPKAPAPEPAPVVDYPPASQACESGAERIYSLGVMGSDCETARRISGAYDARVMDAGEWPGKTLMVDGWACEITSRSGDGGEVHALACRQNTAAITFEWGV